MDFIIAGFIAGALVAIAGFFMFEFAHDDVDVEAGHHSIRQRQGLGLMVGALITWALIALAAASGASSYVAALAMILGLVISLALAWWAGARQPGEPGWSVLAYETAPAAFDASSAYDVWPTQAESDGVGVEEIDLIADWANSPLSTWQASQEWLLPLPDEFELAVPSTEVPKEVVDEPEFAVAAVAEQGEPTNPANEIAPAEPAIQPPAAVEPLQQLHTGEVLSSLDDELPAWNSPPAVAVPSENAVPVEKDSLIGDKLEAPVTDKEQDGQSFASPLLAGVEEQQTSSDGSFQSALLRDIGEVVEIVEEESGLATLGRRIRRKNS